MAEQSHKREMSDAVRGDFERLRRRLEGAERKAARPPSPPAERVVVTPRRAVEEDAEHGPEPTGQLETEPSPEAASEVPAEPARSWLRSVLRRG